MRDRGLLVIAIFKLSKAVLLLFVAVGSLSLLDFKIRTEAWHRLIQLSGDAHFRALEKVANILGIATDKRIVLVSFGALFYASLFATEGIGLLMQKRWAEYFTSIVTASFLPIEVYEIIRRPDNFKIGLLAVNVLVLVYLIWRLNSK